MGCPGVEVDLGKVIDQVLEDGSDLEGIAQVNGDPDASIGDCIASGGLVTIAPDGSVKKFSCVAPADLSKLSSTNKASADNHYVVARGSSCPNGMTEQEIAMGNLSPTLQDYVKETGNLSPVKECVIEGETHNVIEADVHKLTLIPTGAQFKGVQFTVGIITVPAIIDFAAQMLNTDKILNTPLNPTVSKGIAAGATLALHIGLGMRSAGPSSFVLGALLGQIPGLLEEASKWAVDQLTQPAAIAYTAPPEGEGSPEMPGIYGSRYMGQESDEDELEALREELQDISGTTNRYGTSVGSGNNNWIVN